MAKVAAVGCRDCALCTGNAFTGTMRGMGRQAANWSTLGIAALARKKCQACSHPMSEHRGNQQPQQQQQPLVVVQQSAAPAAPAVTPTAPPSLPAGWYADPTDPQAQCWWDGTAWRPETKHYPTP